MSSKKKPEKSEKSEKSEKKSPKSDKKASKRKDITVDTALLDALVERASIVREHAHAPYSRYRVGAAIATRSGLIFEGCNVENASLGATICAERGAIMQMIAAGVRDPIACAVVTEDGGSPCGICRQVLAEFADDMPIALVSAKKKDSATGHIVQLADLLPLAFSLR